MSERDQSLTATVLNASTALSTEANLRAVKEVKLSAEQLAIAGGVKNKALGNIVVIARAGTGKTFLILQCLSLVAGRSIVMAFGSKIAAEIDEKIKKAGHRYSSGRTFHSLAMEVMFALYPKSKKDGKGARNAGYNKMTRVLKEVELEGETGVPEFLKSFVKRTVSMAMNQGAGIDGMFSAKDLKKWYDMIAYYRIDSAIADNNLDSQLVKAELEQKMGRELQADEAREEIIKIGIRWAYACLNLCKKLAHEVWTYDEALWLPLLLNADIPTYDFVFVDEAQDSNPVRVEWVRRMVRKGGRVMFVGDDKQAIMGFTGAMNNALETIKAQFACTEFKMTVTFRCSKAVAALAAEMVPDYKAADTNPEGRVEYIDEDQFAEMALVPGQDAIICRNTRPLVALAFNLIRRGIPCHIEGREIGGDLIMQIDQIDNRIKSIAKFLPRLADWLEIEVAKLKKAEADMEAEALEDRIGTIRSIMENMPEGSTVEDAKAKIRSLFGNVGELPRPTVALMTAHKSKGLEFNRVFGWGVRTWMPSKRAQLSHEMDQEFNLEYVLKTRAIMEYWEVYVVPPPPANSNNPQQRRAA